MHVGKPTFSDLERRVLACESKTAIYNEYVETDMARRVARLLSGIPTPDNRMESAGMNGILLGIVSIKVYNTITWAAVFGFIAKIPAIRLTAYIGPLVIYGIILYLIFKHRRLGYILLLLMTVWGVVAELYNAMSGMSVRDNLYSFGPSILFVLLIVIITICAIRKNYPRGQFFGFLHPNAAARMSFLKDCENVHDNTQVIHTDAPASSTPMPTASKVSQKIALLNGFVMGIFGMTIISDVNCCLFYYILSKDIISIIPLHILLLKVFMLYPLYKFYYKWSYPLVALILFIQIDRYYAALTTEQISTISNEIALLPTSIASQMVLFFIVIAVSLLTLEYVYKNRKIIKNNSHIIDAIVYLSNISIF